MLTFGTIQICWIVLLSVFYYRDLQFSKYIALNIALIFPLTYTWTYLDIPVRPFLNYYTSFHSNTNMLALLSFTITKCIISYFILDVYTYIMHRTLHTSWCMRHIHYIHHQCPVYKLHPLQAWHMHPLEFICVDYGRIYIFHKITNPDLRITLLVSLLISYQNLNNHTVSTQNIHWLHHKLVNVYYARTTDWMVSNFIGKKINIYDITNG